MTRTLRRYKCYPAYKDSGAEWLGQVPETWDALKLKRVLTEPLAYGANESAELTDRDLPRYIRIKDIREDGTLRDDTFRSISQDVASPYLLKEGDLLFARSGATVGKTIRYDQSWGPAAHAGYLIRARLNESVASRYVYYFTKSTSYQDWLRANFIQATIQNVSAERYSDLVIPVPPISQQAGIVNFLDERTARIDELIAKKERLIELLEETRSALVARAVTNGLNADVEMKDPGIEWLGQIPTHWETKPNSQLFVERNERGRSDLPILEVSIASGVRLREFSDIRVEQRSDDLTTYKVARQSDIVFNKMRMWQGAVGVAPIDGLVSPDYIVARPLNPSTSDYYALLFRTKSYMGEVYRFSHGIVDDRNRLYWPDLERLFRPSRRTRSDTRSSRLFDGRQSK